MALISSISPTRAANAATWASAEAGGDTFTNTGSELLVIRHTNGGGSAVTLTITTTHTVDGEAVADKTISIPAGETHVIGPFPTGIYNTSSNDPTVSLGWSDHTDIELIVLKP